MPLAFAGAWLSAAACSSPVQCPCPISGVTSVAVPNPDSAQIAGASTDPPCTAVPGPDSNVQVARDGAGTCHVRVQLTSGETYAFSLQFRVTGGACCPGLVTAVDASVPELVDAGGDANVD